MMSPTLCGGRDYVFVVPTNKFVGDTLYVLDTDGRPTVWQGQAILHGIRISAHNPVYSGSAETVSRREFSERVLGVVVADLKVRDMQAITRG